MREPDGSMNERSIFKKEIVEHRWQEAGRRDGGNLTAEDISGISGQRGEMKKG